jgi:hypothetical protein
VELFECYVKADVDGDGVAETIRAFYAGAGGTGELAGLGSLGRRRAVLRYPLRADPASLGCAVGADDTADIQRVKTVITRQFLDNTYWVNNPMTTAERARSQS